jgi:hypothetical protein
MIIEGLENNASEGSMKAQLLKGEQEEIYWMKLPDKVRPPLPNCCTALTGRGSFASDTHGGPSSTVMTDGKQDSSADTYRWS